MTLTAAILLIISAITHAGWNYISKKEHPTPAFYLVANTIGVICVFPILLYFGNQIPLVPKSVWIFIATSGFFLAAYMAALAGAYRAGDISIAYPLARSLPVIFVFLITLIFGKGKPLGAWFIIGIILVVAGCAVLPLKALRELQLSNYKNLCCLLAVLAAVGIAGYTVTDDAALRNLRDNPGKPWNPVDATLVYMVLEGISCSIWQFLIVAFDPRERKTLIDVMHDFKGAAAITGIGIYLTYGLVLASMNYVTNVSYVAAFRQLSIPLGAMFGMVLLKEPRHIPKIIGVLIIFLGLTLIGAS
jgi:drug/metabolite transporter (DMT)-like permease